MPWNDSSKLLSETTDDSALPESDAFDASASEDVADDDVADNDVPVDEVSDNDVPVEAIEFTSLTDTVQVMWLCCAKICPLHSKADRKNIILFICRIEL